MTDHNCLQQFDKFLILWSSSPIYRKRKFWKLLHWKKNREIILIKKRKWIYSWRIFVIWNHCDVRRKEGRRGDFDRSSSVCSSTFQSSATTEWRARQCTAVHTRLCALCSALHWSVVHWSALLRCCTAPVPAASPSVEYEAVGSTFVVPSYWYTMMNSTPLKKGYIFWGRWQ